MQVYKVAVLLYFRYGHVNMFRQKVYLAILAGYSSFVASLPTEVIPKTLDTEKRFLSVPFSVTHANLSADSTGLRHTKRAFGTSISKGETYYQFDLLVGSNQQQVGLLIDTGSSDTWVVDKNAQCSGNTLCKEKGTYDPTQSSTSHKLDETFFIQYIDQTTTSGYYYLDDVTIPQGPTLKQFQFADSTAVSELFGILGIGLIATEQPVDTFEGPAYPNFPFALKNQGYISKAAYSVYLNDAEASSGTLLFGGIDNAKIEGGLLELPGAFTDRLGINVDFFSIDGSVYSVATGFVFDTGYPYSALPPTIADAIGTALSGGEKVGGVYPYNVDCAQPDKNFTVTFGSGDNQKDINFPYSSFVAPWGPIGGSGPTCNSTLLYSSDGSDPNDLPTFGQNTFNSFYLVFDVEGNNISVGQAKYTTDSNISNIQ